jgi:tetratricopeptide (TPR) repeat protein
MVKKIITYLFLFLTSITLVHAASTADSLRNLLDNTTSDEEQIDLLIELSDETISDSIDQSVQYANEALELARSLNKRDLRAKALAQMGYVYNYLYKEKEALSYFNKSLTIYKDINNRQGIAEVLNSIGLTYYYLHQHDTAKTIFKKSLEIAKKAGIKKEEANALQKLGNIFKYENDENKALIYYQNALKIYEEIDEENGIASTHNSIGLIYYNRGKYDSAIIHYQKTKELRESIGDLRGSGIAINNIGNSYYARGKIEEALPYYFEALRKFEKIEFQRGIASCVNNIALIYEEWDKLDQALEYHQKALKVRQEMGNESEIASTLNNIANVQTAITENKFSSLYGEDWIDTIVRHKDHDTLLNKFKEAQKNQEKALEIRKKMDDKAGIAASLNNIGTIQMYSGNFNKAKDYFNEALKINNEINNAKESATNLLGIGRCYEYLNKYETALSYYRRGEKIAKKIEDKAKLKLIYESISDVYGLKGDYQKSLSYYKRYSDIKDEILNEDLSKQLAEQRTRYETEKKEAQLKIISKEKELVEQRNKTMRLTIIFFIVGFFIIGGLVVLVIRQNKKVKQANSLLETKNELITKQHEEIKDSINYARQIQVAILPPSEYIKELLPERFILFKPRDVVSGDFYYFTKKGNRTIVVAADCTGHGVPGAFMSMLGTAFLNEIINKNPGIHANEILNELRAQVIKSLHQTGKAGGSQDGMDLALYILDYDNNKIEFAGANNPLILIRNNELEVYKGDKMPIGIYAKADEPFANNIIDMKKGDCLYTFSDGYQDQFGGPQGKKYKIKNMKDLLLNIHQKDMAEQGSILDKEIKQWMGKDHEQIDDIIVIGTRI